MNAHEAQRVLEVGRILAEAGTDLQFPGSVQIATPQTAYSFSIKRSGRRFESPSERDMGMDLSTTIEAIAYELLFGEIGGSRRALSKPKEGQTRRNADLVRRRLTTLPIEDGYVYLPPSDMGPQYSSKVKTQADYYAEAFPYYITEVEKQKGALIILKPSELENSHRSHLEKLLSGRVNKNVINDAARILASGKQIVARRKRELFTDEIDEAARLAIIETRTMFGE